MKNIILNLSCSIFLCSLSFNIFSRSLFHDNTFHNAQVFEHNCHIVTENSKLNTKEIISYIKKFQLFRLCINDQQFSKSQIKGFLERSAQVTILADRTNFSKFELRDLVEKGARIQLLNEQKQYSAREIKYLSEKGIQFILTPQVAESYSQKEILDFAKEGYPIHIYARQYSNQLKKLKNFLKFKNVTLYVDAFNSNLNKKKVFELEALGAKVYFP